MLVLNKNNVEGCIKRFHDIIGVFLTLLKIIDSRNLSFFLFVRVFETIYLLVFSYIRVLNLNFTTYLDSLYSYLLLSFMKIYAFTIGRVPQKRLL